MVADAIGNHASHRTPRKIRPAKKKSTNKRGSITSSINASFVPGQAHISQHQSFPRNGITTNDAIAKINNHRGKLKNKNKSRRFCWTHSSSFLFLCNEANITQIRAWTNKPLNPAVSLPSLSRDKSPAALAVMIKRISSEAEKKRRKKKHGQVQCS